MLLAKVLEIPLCLLQLELRSLCRFRFQRCALLGRLNPGSTTSRREANGTEEGGEVVIMAKCFIPCTALVAPQTPYARTDAIF